MVTIDYPVPTSITLYISERMKNHILKRNRYNV